MSEYTWNAEDYAIHSQAQQQWAKELIEKLSLDGTEDVLDLGCGDGKVTAELARMLPQGSVVGIDNAPSMIALAKKRNPQNEYPNLSFEVMDASDLAFDGCFHLVFSNAALHWVKDHEPVFKGLFRCLRSRGRILLQMGGKGNAGQILTVLNEVRSLPEWKPYFVDFEFPYGFFGVEDYQALLADAGFKPNRVGLIQKDMQHAGKSGLEGWIRTTWLPYTQRVPEGVRHRFIEAISSRYLEQVPLDADGRAHVAMVRLEVDAEKIA